MQTLPEVTSLTADRASDRRFAKHYASEERLLASVRNYALLAEIGVARMPRVLDVSTGQRVIVYERIMPIRGVEDDDVVIIAAEMGCLHAASMQHLQRISRSFAFAQQDPLPHRALPRFSRIVGDGSGDPVDVARIAAAAPRAIYKDSNVRNFVVGSAGIFTVDFDDLTCAPIGYDLAKLVLSVELTRGTPNDELARRARRAYNAALASAGSQAQLGRTELALWMDLNYVLTRKYLGSNGYVRVECAGGVAV